MSVKIRSVAVALATLSAAVVPAAAHPHVFLTQQVSVVFDKGAIVALDHVWTFDEFFTAMAVADLDTNKDGKHSREELQPLAKTNVEALKEFNYYTYPKLAGSDLKLGTATDAFGTVTDGKFALHFRVPLEQPVLAEAKGFEFSVYDPSYFIAFELAEKEGITLAAGAPQGCKAEAVEPEKTAADARRLGESFFEQLGGGPLGVSFSKTVRVSCLAR